MKIKLSELREMVKSIIKEYDREGLKYKYENLPDTDMDKYLNYSKERQKRVGIKFVGLNYPENKYFITKSDIKLYNSKIDDNILTVRGSISNVLSNISGWEDSELSFDIIIQGEVSDSQLNVIAIEVRSNSGGSKGMIIPADKQEQAKFNNIIKGKLIDFSDIKNEVQDIFINRNAIFKKIRKY